ncbi:hypothetical protein NG819_10935 [Pseudarthrobacter sp. Fe7]|nr:hypothetical protein NG819_10935 [Pseudarthrobacter sp. Fe7]
MDPAVADGGELAGAEGCGAVVVVGAGTAAVGAGEEVAVGCGDGAAEVWAGAGVGLGSTANATPVMPGPASNEAASRAVPMDFMTGRRD